MGVIGLGEAHNEVMSVFADRPTLRWVVPVAAVTLIGAGSLLVSQQASADSGLAPRTAAQLLVDVQNAGHQPFSGTVTQRIDLGLPEIPSLSGGSPAGAGGSSAGSGATTALTSMLSGTHTWRVWVGGPTQSRLALVGGSGETDVIRNGSDVWLWSSADTSAVHEAVTVAPNAHAMSPTDLPRTPAEAAQQALAAVDPTTTVTTSGTAVVAGRQAYELVLAPKGGGTPGGTRVAQVRIAVDAATRVPLGVEVFSTKQANPVIDVRFSSVDMGAPDASRFTFTPPPGTTVTEPKANAEHAADPAAKPPVKVVGKGWSAVAVVTVPKQAAGAGSAASTGDQGQLTSMLASLPKVSGSWGSGHLFEGTLFSAVLTNDGRVAVGAVDPSALYAALASS